MSDTPRTDQIEKSDRDCYNSERECGWPPHNNFGFEFARQLERELNAAKAPLHFSAKLPDKEGWWFAKWNSKTAFVRVFRALDGLAFEDAGRLVLLCDTNMFWCGPIQEPED